MTRLSRTKRRPIGATRLGSSASRFLFLLLLLIVAGCQVQLISSYDQVTDESLVALQKKTETFFETLARDPAAGEYARTQSFYATTRAELLALHSRNEARDKNEITVKQLATLIDQFDQLERLNKDHAIKPAEVEIPRRIMQQSIGAVAKLELAKKSGSQ